jgi:hypothetical protein
VTLTEREDFSIASESPTSTLLIMNLLELARKDLFIIPLWGLMSLTLGLQGNQRSRSLLRADSIQLILVTILRIQVVVEEEESHQ